MFGSFRMRTQKSLRVTFTCDYPTIFAGYIRYVYEE